MHTLLPSPCAAPCAASWRRRRPRCAPPHAADASRGDTAVAEEEAEQEEPAFRDFLHLDYDSTPLPYHEVTGAESVTEMFSVLLGLNQLEVSEAAEAALPPPRANLQWLPAGLTHTTCRDARGLPPFDLLSLDAEQLLSEVDLTPELVAELERLDRRYFLDRVLSRSQLLERCRRIYERDPADVRAPLQEVDDLLLSFQQLEENHFTITNWVGERAEVRDAEIGEMVASARTAPQSLPDCTNLAIADVAMFMEFQKELLLQSVKEDKVVKAAAERKAREKEALAAERRRQLAATAKQLGVPREVAIHQLMLTEEELDAAEAEDAAEGEQASARDMQPSEAPPSEARADAPQGEVDDDDELGEDTQIDTELL